MFRFHRYINKVASHTGSPLFARLFTFVIKDQNIVLLGNDLYRYEQSPCGSYGVDLLLGLGIVLVQIGSTGGSPLKLSPYRLVISKP